MGSFTTIDEGFSWLSGFANFEKKSPEVREYSLDRMASMLAAFGNPQNSFKSIHVAGSKGKGSTCAYAARMLEELGYSTGIYASPHVLDWRERITRPSGFFPDWLYLQALEDIRRHVESMDGSGVPENPTTFELLTLLAFEVFRRAGLEWAVVETGLGGRLDATNLIRPELCLITHLELEHTEVLGPSLGHIAFEKAGIFKPGTPAISLEQEPEARSVLETQGISRGCEIMWLEGEEKIRESEADGSWILPPAGGSECFQAKPGMKSRHQALNAGLAWLGIRTLVSRGMLRKDPSALEAACRKAMEDVRLHARQEMLEPPSRSALPRVLLDAGHTRDSVLELSRTVETLMKDPPGRPAVLVFALAKDKDASAILPSLARLKIPIIITSPGYFKESDPEGLYRSLLVLLPPHGHGAMLQPRVDEALRKALELAGNQPGGLLVIAGSFYLCGEVMPDLGALGYRTGEFQ